MIVNKEMHKLINKIHTTNKKLFSIDSAYNVAFSGIRIEQHWDSKLKENWYSIYYSNKSTDNELYITFTNKDNSQVIEWQQSTLSDYSKAIANVIEDFVSDVRHFINEFCDNGNIVENKYFLFLNLESDKWDLSSLMVTEEFDEDIEGFVYSANDINGPTLFTKAKLRKLMDDNIINADRFIAVLEKDLDTWVFGTDEERNEICKNNELFKIRSSKLACTLMEFIDGNGTILQKKSSYTSDDKIENSKHLHKRIVWENKDGK